MSKRKSVALPDITSKTRKCGECKGRGHVLTPARWPFPSGTADQCPKCYGRGVR